MHIISYNNNNKTIYLRSTKMVFDRNTVVCIQSCIYSITVVMPPQSLNWNSRSLYYVICRRYSMLLVMKCFGKKLFNTVYVQLLMTGLGVLYLIDYSLSKLNTKDEYKSWIQNLRSLVSNVVLYGDQSFVSYLRQQHTTLCLWGVLV